MLRKARAINGVGRNLVDKFCPRFYRLKGGPQNRLETAAAM
jgi:hypothetical protein